jgi:hypothetical protein
MAGITVEELAACGLLLGDDEIRNLAIAEIVADELGRPRSDAPGILRSLRGVQQDLAAAAAA